MECPYFRLALSTTSTLNMDTEQKSIRLLLVEDDAAFAKAISAAISRKATFSVDLLLAADLGSALTMVMRASTDRGAPKYDVILLDLTLPDSRGLETLITMRNNCFGIPIIVLTGRDDEQLAMRALQHGAQDYLVKGDIDGRSLSRSIRYAIERGKISAEREEFVATLTHDLKGPLQGSNRILDLFIKGDIGPVSLEQKDLLRRLAESNDTLLEMIANLLEVYRYEKDLHTIVFAHTNLNKIVHTCMTEVDHLARERCIEIRQEGSISDEVMIMADCQSIARVLRNLLDNALKFTPRGGVVTIKVAQDQDDKVKLSVADTGPGISEEDHRYLFERFYRGTTGRGYSRSTGLGLYLCRQIVNHHNGTISVDSNQKNGSVFLLEFPRARA